MKTSLILSTVFCALTLAPAAFATGAQEQTSAVTSPAAASIAANTSVTVFTVQQLPQAISVTRSVLQQLDLDVRADLLQRLRASSTFVIEAIEMVAPAVAESASKALDLSAR
jgi:hypothetical protein